MEIIKTLIDFIIHIDTHLSLIIQDWGAWSYLILFAIIFCETGLVVTPFLPGDSLLFACGAFAAAGAFNVAYLFLVLLAAAVLGDSANYAIGHIFGDKMFTPLEPVSPGGKQDLAGFTSRLKSCIFKKEHLDRTHKFYEKYGGRTIIFARFVPIVRTFAPFVAGVGRMSYGKFFAYNVVGGLLWTAGFIFAGYFFGNLPAIKHNFTLVIGVIIIVSVLPAAIEVMRHRQCKSESTAG
jgi:membrane-associated protein